MRSTVLYCFLLLCACSSANLYAQQARYSATVTGREIHIAGRVGNSIHAWSVSKEQHGIFHENTVLNLYIYSGDLSLAGQKKFDLGESILKNIEFQLADNFYYVNILYATSANKRLMLKVDEYGNSTDITGAEGVWKEMLLPRMRNISSVSANSNSIFGIKTERADTGIVTDLQNVTLLGGERLVAGKNYEKLVIRKADRHNTKLMAEQIYASAWLSFSRTLIIANDTAVFATAFADAAASDRNPYSGSHMFIARLDTNLAETAYGHLLFKNKPSASKELFSPSFILPVNKKLLVISTGLYNKTSYSYYRDTRTGVTSYIPQLVNSFVTSSLRITQTDENNRLFMDTIIAGKQGREHLVWDNLFVTTTDNGADLFCGHQYSGTRAGITHFSIDKNGVVTEKELQVDEKFTYSLTETKKIAPGLLLVPFTRRGKRGFMRLNYTAAG